MNPISALPENTSPISLDIAVEHSAWAQALPDVDALCDAALDMLLKTLPDLKVGELSLALVDDAQIQTLNREYRSKDAATNVLSFPAGPTPDDCVMLGDVVIALETLTREAEAKSVSLAAHFSHLFIHGFLHLQGYDHEVSEEAEVMESLEINVLNALNIQNPYAENLHLDKRS